MEKLSIITLLAVLSLTIIVSGCTSSSASSGVAGGTAPGTANNLDAGYSSTNTTSSGRGLLTLAFQVRDGKVVYCSGAYTYTSASGEQEITPCDKKKLQNNEYPFSLQKNLLSIKKGEKLNGTVMLGSGNYYSWYITPIN